MELLSEALEANQYDLDDYALLDMVQVTHIRESYSESPETEAVHHTLVGFAVELDDVNLSKTVIDNFAQSLADSAPIYHAIKFEDPLLQGELAEFSVVMFELEMKLRRALSFLYLHAYPNEPYNLLRKDRMKTMPPNIPQSEMQEAIENQFFHLTFGQYTHLNQRHAFGPKELFEAILESNTYDSLKAELLSAPIVHEDDVELLDDLRKLMDPN